MHRGFAAFHHIGQQRHATAKLCAGYVHVFGGAQGFNEQGIHPAGKISLSPSQCGIQALCRQRVGAGQDQCVGIRARIQRGLELAHHLLHRHHRLAIQMAAALGEGLVFQLDHGGTCPLKPFDRAHHIKRVAKTCVSIHDDRQTDTLGDAGQRVGHLGEGGQTNVRAAQSGVGNGSP